MPSPCQGKDLPTEQQKLGWYGLPRAGLFFCASLVLLFVSCFVVPLVSQALLSLHVSVNGTPIFYFSIAIWFFIEMVLQALDIRDGIGTPMKRGGKPIAPWLFGIVAVFFFLIAVITV